MSPYQATAVNGPLTACAVGATVKPSSPASCTDSPSTVDGTHAVRRGLLASEPDLLISAFYAGMIRSRN
jgi:hypothetical protein